MTGERDLVVVGGGPAGLAVAIRAASAGLGVTLLDRSRPPVDKACGEGLMPDGARRLGELGVEVEAEGCRPFPGIRYIDGDLVAEGRFPGAPGLGVRRTVLHAAMVRRAEEVGVDLRWGVHATGVSEGVVETGVGPVGARFTAVADGLKSRLRGALGLAGAPGRRRRFGVRRHFAVEPWTDLVEVYWGDGCEAYVTPVAPGLVGVALIWSGGRGSFDELIARFPSLEARLEGAEVASRDRGAGPFEQRTRGVVAGSVALVGDASGYLDPVTGEGMALAFAQGFALVDAVVAGDLGRYARAHPRVGRVPLAITRLLLAVEERPALRRRMVSALADPVLFGRLLGLHADQLPFATTLPGVALSLARGLVGAGRGPR